jgi:DNA-binding transcriptional MerR regulator
VFKIGDFSRLTRVSVKMLRHYDEIGLLKPADVDASSGYRFYTAAQLPRLNRIIALKDLGFSLDQIAGLLAEDLSPEALRGMLLLRQAEIAARIRADQQRMAQVEMHLRQVDQAERPPLFDVVLRALPALLVASARRRVPDLEDSVAQLFDVVELPVAARRARAQAGPILLYHDRDYREEDADVEVAIPLTAPFAPPEGIAVRELPAVACAACAVYTGDYARLPEVLQAILRWIGANGYRVSGPIREHFLRFMSDRAAELGLPETFLAQQGSQLVTEVQIPVETDGGG